MCLKIYELEPVYFVSAPGLAWQTCLQKTKVKLKLLTDYEMLLMVENEISGGICQTTHRYAKANNKYMKNYEESIDSSYIAYLGANNLYRWAMSQKLPVNGFKWVKNLSEFNKDFIKNYDENSDKGYFLKVDVEHQKSYLIAIKIYHFYPKEKKLKKSKDGYRNEKDKTKND